VLGPTVNVAARLCGQAGALEVLVSAGAVEAVGDAASFGVERRVSLKGLPEALGVHRLIVA